MKWVKKFLAANPEYIKDTLLIKGVKDSGRKSRDVFAVILGYGRMLQNYPGGSRPNAEITFDPGRGFNCGALTLTAKSRTHSGLSRGKEIFIDRSLNHAENTGPLDHFFQKLEAGEGVGVQRGVHGPSGGEVGEGEGGEEPKAEAEKHSALVKLPTESTAPQSTSEPWSAKGDDGLTFSLSLGKVMISNANATNKKISKNLLLAEWLDGEVPRRSDRAARELGPPRCVCGCVFEPSRGNV